VPVADAAGIYGMDTRRAVAAGLVIRPLEATVADTWAWLRDGGELSPWRDQVRGEGLDAARERALLGELVS
jgi:2'-hydroxyisoflavone reductase